MNTSPLTRVLATLGITALFGCNPTMSDLRAENPRAETLEVPCRPGLVPDNVEIMALTTSGDIVTDERTGELLSAAPAARVFIKFNADAPEENARFMASQYGLSCPNMPNDRATESESESLRGKPPCPAEVTQSNGLPNPNLLAAPGNPDCDPPGQANAGTTANSGTAAKKVQSIVRVCPRPPGVGTNVGRWASRDTKGHLLTNNDKVFADAVANADIIFIYDENAEPESVYWFVKDPAQLSCPNQPPPMPYDKATASGRLEFMASVAARGTALNEITGGKGNGKTTATGGGTTSTTAPLPTSTPSTTPKNGDGKTTDTSSPTGKGPPLSVFERISRDLALGAALLNADTSGNAKHPEGDRHGMVNGTNVGGWSFPPLQAGLSLFQVITAVGVPSKHFIDKIAAATKGGQRVIINEADKAALKMADELVKDFSQYEMAKGFQEIDAVLPFKLGQKFTAGLESKFQAHKIFEKQAFDYFDNVFPKKELDDAIAKAPSVILTDTEHKAITNRLNDFWRKAKTNREKPKVSQKDLRDLYQEVYKDHPHWLQAIEHLLRQVP